MKTLGEVLRLSSAFLAERKAEPSRRMAEELLAHLLQVKRIDLYLQFERPIEEAELAQLREWLKRAAKGEPVEYLTGEVEFFGCRIRVDSRVLIPRPETEILTDHIAKRMKGEVLWDLCAGAGAIGISLKKKFPHLSVSISDLSEEALALARENIQLNGVEVETCQGDLLAPFAGRKADIVVCNPPYLSDKEYLEVDFSVRGFEPKRALVGGERGVEFYEWLAAELPPYLNGGSQVFLEIGATQGDAVKEIFHSGPWVKKELLSDWSGKSRFFFLEKQ